jgi:hypothetical protein
VRLYAVTRPDWPEDRRSIIVQSRDREQAKRTAKPELGGDPDEYVVEPLPAPGDKARVIWMGPS